MPETVFIDTGYILALVNENDQQHAEALALSKRFDGHPVVVTDAVLLEIGNALSRIDRDAAVQIIEDLRQSPGVTVEQLTPSCLSRRLRCIGATPISSGDWSTASPSLSCVACS